MICTIKKCGMHPSVSPSSPTRSRTYRVTQSRFPFPPHRPIPFSRIPFFRLRVISRYRFVLSRSSTTSHLRTRGNATVARTYFGKNPHGALLRPSIPAIPRCSDRAVTIGTTCVVACRLWWTACNSSGRSTVRVVNSSRNQSHPRDQRRVLTG